MTKQLAFEGAEGFACYSRGGRGGETYIVDSLDDDGDKKGTLRHAIEKGARPLNVTFSVSGNINLGGSKLKIERGEITISGESAPNKGIALVNGVLQIFASHVIIRYIRVRQKKNSGEDSVTIRRGNQIIIDHCSFSWGGDEVFTINPDGKTEEDIYLKKITIQNCFIYEAFGDGDGNHRFATILAGASKTRTSFLKNLIAHCDSRNPRVANRVEKNWDDSPPKLDFRNNLVYNWGKTPGYNGEDVNNPFRMNYVKNVYLTGKSTDSDDHIFEEKGSTEARAFFKRNMINDKKYVDDPYEVVDFDGWSGSEKDKYRNTDSFDIQETDTIDVDKVVDHVLENAGCNLPERDSADIRIVKNVKYRTGTIVENVDDNIYNFPNLN